MQLQAKDVFMKWYIAVLIQRFDLLSQDTNNPNRRCDMYENMMLICANDDDQAYDKALEWGKAGDQIECIDEKGRKSMCRFVGISELLPIYDPIEDGCEILCTTGYFSAKTIDSFVKNKEELQIFKDKAETEQNKQDKK